MVSENTNSTGANSDSNKPKGTAFILNESGVVVQILRDDINFFDNTTENPLLTSLIDSQSVQKALNMLEMLKISGSVFKWELQCSSNKEYERLNFSGIKNSDGLILVASPYQQNIENYFDELMKINNEHINSIRSLSKKYRRIKSDQKESQIYDELTQLNNELSSAQRKLAKKTAELEKTNEIKNRMIGMAAHDLRNPLTIIQTYSDFLLDDFSKKRDDNADGEIQTIIKEIRNASQFMLNLVTDLLNVSHIESGKITLSITEIDLIAFFDHQVSINTMFANKKNISLKFNPDISSLTIEADKEKIQQVVNNLISNAIKYSHSNTTITLDVTHQPKEKMVVFSVQDEGQGIPEEEIKELFKPFANISVQPTSGEDSTGLGLAITKRIVDAHNGTIWVESTPGEGSTFFVKLPMEQ